MVKRDIWVQQTRTTSVSTEQLFLSLSEQLRYAFLQIARTAELAPTLAAAEQLEYWDLTQQVADTALQIAESYALQARMHADNLPLAVEPLAASSLLYDAAQALDPLAKRYGVQLELDNSRHSQPIMGNRELLQAAMVSLGQVFVLAQAQSGTNSPVRLAAHQSRYGVVAGVYGDQHEIDASALRRARQLAGVSVQPFAKLAAGPVAGVFIAESLLQSMATKLHVARYQKLSGLATTLPSCNQLQLV